jgi:hypothetical protein
LASCLAAVASDRAPTPAPPSCSSPRRYLANAGWLAFSRWSWVQCWNVGLARCVPHGGEQRCGASREERRRWHDDRDTKRAPIPSPRLTRGDNPYMGWSPRGFANAVRGPCGPWLLCRPRHRRVGRAAPRSLHFSFPGAAMNTVTLTRNARPFVSPQATRFRPQRHLHLARQRRSPAWGHPAVMPAAAMRPAC